VSFREGILFVKEYFISRSRAFLIRVCFYAVAA